MIVLQRRQHALETLRSSTALEQIEWFEEIDSTNQHARRLVVAGESRLPALLVADRQTAGRGRSDRQWWSPDGCLMFSLIIDSNHLPSEPATWPQLSLVAGVAAAQAAESLIQPDSPTTNSSAQNSMPTVIELKWPNDLYAGGRKLAGILVEAIPLPSPVPTEPAGLPRMAFVIGIGLNVAVDFSQAPEEIRQRGGSLSSLTRRSLYVEDALVPIIEQIFAELAAWRAGSQSWWQAWNDRNLLAGRNVHLRLAGGVELMGLCEGIDLSGRLLVRDTRGLHEIQSADVVGWN